MTDADVTRIERKLDRLLYLLGDGRPRTSAEIGREADAIILRLHNRRQRIKKGHERANDSDQ
jgi:hypothetical protein